MDFVIVNVFFFFFCLFFHGDFVLKTCMKGSLMLFMFSFYVFFGEYFSRKFSALGIFFSSKYSYLFIEFAIYKMAESMVEDQAIT